MTGVPTVPLTCCDCGVRDHPLVTSTVIVAVASSPSVSVAVTVKAVGSIVAAGVPVMTPVSASSTSPLGRAGETAYVGSPSNPVAVNAADGARAWPTTPSTVCTAGVITESPTVT